MPSKIEWCQETWNPITGCTKISEGCAHCYAERMSKRLAGRYGYPADEPFNVIFHPDRLAEPSSWKKPRMIFVCSMGDIFHKDVAWNWIFSVFQMAGTLPRHKFLFLTKRPDRASELINGDLGFHLTRQDWCNEWPLPNVWLGVTAENQKRADERIPVLLQIPAAVRFVSVEPMLGPVDLKLSIQNMATLVEEDYHLYWVICGGESGPGARPMHPDWPRGLRDQCVAASVPFFFKQWGEWIPNVHGDKSIPAGTDFNKPHHFFDDMLAVAKVGKKKAGRLLDGRTWDENPTF